MTDDIMALLKVNEYFRGMSNEDLQHVVRFARVTDYQTGDIVHEANVLLSRIGFVLSGRVKALRVDARGRESFLRMIERGMQFGMVVGALTEPIPVRVVALEPTTILSLDYEEAMEFSLRRPEVRRLWLRTIAESLRRHFFGAAAKHAPMMLALMHETPATHRVAEKLIARLHGVGEKLAVFSDSDEWCGLPDVRHRRLHVDGRVLSLEEIRRQVGEWQDTNRIIFDVHAGLAHDLALRLLEVVDRAIYFVQATSPDAALRRLESLDVPRRGWRDKISVAWVLERGSPVVPAASRIRDLTGRDFKISETAPELPWGRVLASGLERLVHDLRGVRIGLALGGGAARGMSHLGVLKALEQNGIVVDMIAGTSAGAMTGVAYASGLDCDYSASQFARDLRPPWIFRRLPRGSHWYLFYKYRRGQFDPMLRKYLHNWSLEQLALPCVSVSVDLVSGNSVIRDRGDAVHAILESINLPVLSVPICRNGQALVDGGLVNNIPADVLVTMGCNFIIAASVTAKMEKQFSGITPQGLKASTTKPSVVQTILRSLLVQNHNLNAFGVQPADVVVEPDVTGFDLTEFMCARELAAIGEAAACQQIPRIRQLLTRLDPQLFGETMCAPSLRNEPTLTRQSQHSIA